MENRPGEHTRFSPIPPGDENDQQQWRPDELANETTYISSPQSSLGSAYGTDVAPLRWFGLLAGDVPSDAHEVSALEALGDAALSQRYIQQTRENDSPSTNRDQSLGSPHDTGFVPYASSRLQISSFSPPVTDERSFWQAADPIQLRSHEYEIFERFVNGISLWIDLFDPLKHFSTLVPHLALHNVGLMRAILALGARHLSIKPNGGGGNNVDRTAAVQYYYETLQYLQSAMRFTSYKNSPELLATVLIVSTYEMIDGAAKGWERHLKGVFWIQRSRDITGESGGLEQAVWWAWLRQDIWAAFRERRRCFSFFRPAKPYIDMDVWDMASRIVYIVAQAVNYSSTEDRRAGETDLPSRILRANVLLDLLDEWRRGISIHFNALPLQGPFDSAFTPLWYATPAFGVSIQMYCVARILLLVNQPAAGGYLEYQKRDRTISDCVDTVGGIAMRLPDDASRLMSTQCLYAAGLYCTNRTKQDSIAELIRSHSEHTGWPTNADLVQELRVHWAEQGS